MGILKQLREEMEIVGFAAHNRGYRVNYFSRLKELQRGDIIKYFVDGKKYSYICRARGNDRSDRI